MWLSGAFPPITVLADPLRASAKTGRWKWDASAHLFVFPGDDPARALRALFLAAAAVGLRREWFQSERIDFPHFDLAPAAHDRGIRSKVFTPCDLKQTLQAADHWKAAIAAGHWSREKLEAFLKS